MLTDPAASSPVDEDKSLSPAWQDESVDSSLTNQLLGLMKRSKRVRFYGLMGKRSGVKKPIQVRRRNKGEAFVGLMGRSISGEDSSNRIIPASAAAEVLEKPHDQGSSQEWVQMLN
ncbi:unnamed protein product [Tetraodon nigroviridis]|uniref:(spotted green pufferfish) hypothetical protein n=1 Tax=Tetraodon nigroviridis TaxID=99883 RepID=Q4S4M0_TETNG|nr:unnamed protein product [Tetraodon nigroviridis]